MSKVSRVICCGNVVRTCGNLPLRLGLGLLVFLTFFLRLGRRLERILGGARDKGDVRES